MIYIKQMFPICAWNFVMRYEPIHRDMSIIGNRSYGQIMKDPNSWWFQVLKNELQYVYLGSAPASHEIFP